MNIEKKLIPLLRFPEFQGKGEWTIKKIGEISTSFSGGTPIASTKEYYGGNIPFIRSGEINNDHTTLSLTQMGLDNSSARIVEKGTLLYALYGATSGEVAISKIQGAINQAILAIIPHDDVNVAFIYHYLKKNKENIVSNYIQGGQGNLSSAIINALPIAIPSLIEQSKIAGCLSSIDFDISSMKEKVEQLKGHKKSLMQKMFPQKGQTAPVFRFPEFNTEWKKVTLGDIFVERREHSTITDDLPQLSFTIEEGVIYPDNKKTNKRDFLINDKDNKKYLVTYIDDIIYNPANVIYGAIHKNSLCNGVVSPIYKIFSTSQDASFMEYIVRMPEFIQKMSTYMEGTVLKLRTLKPESFLKMEVFIAPSLAEQRKIAECLSSVDNTIEYYSQKLVILEQHKKGLMQQLFPKLKELKK